jgi:ABC-type iron transport system FetAB ATPase subunit
MRPPAKGKARNMEIAGSRFVLAKSAIRREDTSMSGDERTTIALTRALFAVPNVLSKSVGSRI